MHETPEKSGEKRGRGRPVTGSAMTHAERQRLYRERLKSRPKSEQLSESERKELYVLREIFNVYGDVDNIHELAIPPKSDQLNDLERKELEQLRELIEFYQNRVTRDEKTLDHQVAEIRALNEQITDLMKKNSCLESAIELRDARIRDLESRRRRKK